MRKIVLRNLSPELQALIADRMKREECRPDDAVIAILQDASIERMVEHDIAILKESWEDEPMSTPGSGGCGHVHITIQCGRSQ